VADAAPSRERPMGDWGVGEAVYQRIESWCPCEFRGVLDIKGVGPTPVYLLSQ
jgi:hypothetical protein